ncbi:hypothetical protein BD779DRAFT_1680692 [Infundibulicybe gibba]|nr:hypothetical protein BD779DRAFT_1680692 [Infundibulicybe gibba]
MSTAHNTTLGAEALGVELLPSPDEPIQPIRRVSSKTPPSVSEGTAPNPRPRYAFGVRASTFNTSHDTSRPPPPNPPSPLPPSPTFPSIIAVSPSYTPEPLTHPTLQDDQPFHYHGWTECLVPDESIYYVHPIRQLVTDIDLRDAKLLDAMVAYVEDHCNGLVALNRDLWLRDTGLHENEFLPLRCWVNHQEQSVTSDRPHATGSEAGDDEDLLCSQPGDDRLDAKYRYWSFMEAHPDHTSLPQSAQRRR